jgi:magnesium chelatase accessory protein
MDWTRDGADWPHAAHSQFVELAGQRWHVQSLPGPQPSEPGGEAVVLLVHGTGASTHSWRGLMPLLAQRAAVLAVDLPGHGFSGPPPGGDASLPTLARRLTALVRQLTQPRSQRLVLAVGHSAGAAILVQAVLQDRLVVPALAAINGAFLPFGGVAAPLLSPLARLLHATPGVPGFIASRAQDPAVVRRLVESTGSVLDEQGLALYGRLVSDRAHTRAALAMMAHWELQPLARALPRLAQPLHLLVGTNDRAVAPSQARRVAALAPQAHVSLLPGLGHLAHEEAPQRVVPHLWADLPAAVAA